jgi:hypothetical protein
LQIVIVKVFTRHKFVLVYQQGIIFIDLSKCSFRYGI